MWLAQFQALFYRNPGLGVICHLIKEKTMTPLIESGWLCPAMKTVTRSWVKQILVTNGNRSLAPFHFCFVFLQLANEMYTVLEEQGSSPTVYRFNLEARKSLFSSFFSKLRNRAELLDRIYLYDLISSNRWLPTELRKAWLPCEKRKCLCCAWSKKRKPNFFFYAYFVELYKYLLSETSRKVN